MKQTNPLLSISQTLEKRRHVVFIVSTLKLGKGSFIPKINVCQNTYVPLRNTLLSWEHHAVQSSNFWFVRRRVTKLLERRV